MTEKTFSVPEVPCDHCLHSIEGAVGSLQGVDRVAVDLSAKTVDVAWDETSLDVTAIVTAIEDQGYSVADR